MLIEADWFLCDRSHTSRWSHLRKNYKNTMKSSGIKLMTAKTKHWSIYLCLLENADFFFFFLSL